MRRILTVAIPAVLVFAALAGLQLEVNGRTFEQTGMETVAVPYEGTGTERFTYGTEITNGDRWPVRVTSISVSLSGFDPPLPPEAVEVLINVDPGDRAFVGEAEPFHPFTLEGGEEALLFLRGHSRPGHAEVADLQIDRIVVRSERLWTARTTAFVSEPVEISDQKVSPS